MDSDYNIKIVDVGYKKELDIFIYYNTPTGIDIIYSDKTQFVKDGSGIPPKPSLQLPLSALQKLADALDKMGIKPQKGFIEGELEATKIHLEDMRRLVFQEYVRIENKVI